MSVYKTTLIYVKTPEHLDIMQGVGSLFQQKARRREILVTGKLKAPWSGGCLQIPVVILWIAILSL